MNCCTLVLISTIQLFSLQYWDNSHYLLIHTLFEDKSLSSHVVSDTVTSTWRVGLNVNRKKMKLWKPVRLCFQCTLRFIGVRCNDDQITPLLHSWILRMENRGYRSCCLLDGWLQGSGPRWAFWQRQQSRFLADKVQALPPPVLHWEPGIRFDSVIRGFVLRNDFLFSPLFTWIKMQMTKDVWW